MGDTQFVSIAGYGWTGSSAVVDLLKEYSNVWEAGREFRLIKDPYGFEDLRDVLTNRWDPQNVDIAIRDFIWHTNHLYHPNSTFSLFSGFGYKEYYGDSFLDATTKFINAITGYMYSGYWWFFDFKKTKYEILLTKVKRKLGFNVTQNMMYFSDVTAEEFDSLAQKCICEIFEPLVASYKNPYVILDQAIPSQHPDIAQHYFRNPKMIVVDRDARDIYSDLIKNEGLIGKELSQSSNIDYFIRWYKAYRVNVNKYKKLPYVLYLNFEELVINYEESKAKIEQFLGIKNEDHINPKKYFDPAKSIRNVGIWKKIGKPDDIERIVREIPEGIIQ